MTGIRRPRSLYTNNMDLCSVDHGAQYTVGCRCESATGVPICTRANGGDEVLLNWNLDIAWTGWANRFFTWCLRACRCGSPEGQEELLAESSSQTQISDNVPDPNALSGNSSPLGSTGGTGSSNALGVDTSTWTSSTSSLSRCNGSCAVGSECSTTGIAEDCVCQVQSSTYEPASGVIQYTAACMQSLVSIRDEPVPCPCNETYVSHGCCGSFDGMIWEEPGMKLGELVPESDGL